MTGLAIRVAAVEDERAGFGILGGLPTLIAQTRVVRDPRLLFERLGIYKRITTLCTEKMQLVIVTGSTGE